MYIYINVLGSVAPFYILLSIDPSTANSYDPQSQISTASATERSQQRKHHHLPMSCLWTDQWHFQTSCHVQTQQPHIPGFYPGRPLQASLEGSTVITASCSPGVGKMLGIIAGWSQFDN